MSKNKKMNTKSSSQIIELFNDSDGDDIESLNNGREACINYTTDFDKWTVHHYYAMKKREKFPNMFFYYFPRSLFRGAKMSENDKAKIIEYIFNHKDKNINGKWGYLSLVLDNINISGAELYNTICNNRAIIDLSNSFPLKEDAKPDFDDSISEKVDSILYNKSALYKKVLAEFENYLEEQNNEGLKKKYYNFVKEHEQLYIYCDKNKNMCELIEGIIILNDNKKEHKNKNNNQNQNQNNEIGNNIFLLPKNYYDLNNKNNSEKNEKNIDDNYKKKNEKYKNSKNIKKKSKKLVKNFKLYKCDFDLDLYDENNYNYNNNNPIIEIEENENENNNTIQNDSKVNKHVILDDEDMLLSNNDKLKLNNSEVYNQLNKRGKRSHPAPHPHWRKKDLPLGNKIKYSEDYNKENKENYTKNDQNKNLLNINNSTNLSSNINILDSNSNIYNNIFTPQKEKESTQNNVNNNNNNAYDFNKENVEYFQNEQNIDGYISDFTKKIYYQNEINNRILVFSDNEDEMYLHKMIPRKKKRVTRIKADQPIIIRQKKNIMKYDDFKVVGLETSYIDKNIEKLKRGLMYKKMENKKRKNKKKNK